MFAKWINKTLRKLNGQAGFLGLSILALCSMAVCATDVSAVTGCTPIIGKLPSDAPSIECPTTPCPVFAAGNLGPLSQCVIDGEDPPISNPRWNEPEQGYAGQGNVLNTQACGPPIAALGTNLATGNIYRPNPYMLNCPASIQRVVPLVR